MTPELVDRAAASLRAHGAPFTRKNLFHAACRLAGDAGDFERFVAGPLARRLRRGPIAGLLAPARPPRARRLPREHDSYFPAAILIVDRRELVDLFAASGVLVQARLAIVSADGTPAGVVRWLQRGLRAGFRAPVGYLHDAATVLYPFALEPLATLVEVARAGAPIAFVDLGLPPGGLAARELPFCPPMREPIRELEAPPPASIVAYAARRLATLLPRDEWLAPLKPRRSS
ncbi:MAG: hypothetical protein ACM31C_33425 [Acidobacteriota bacterium]